MSFNTLSIRKHLRSYFVTAFAFDTRSLSIFRIGLAFLLLGDLFFRAQSIEAMLADTGLLPRAAAIQYFVHPLHFSIHFLNGDLSFQWFLWILATGAAIGLLLGWRTRWMIFASWILLLSIQNRNPNILQGGDVLLRLLLFWGFFLPLGSHFSFDARRRVSESSSGGPYFSISTVAYIVQFVSLYIFVVCLKQSDEWLGNFSAVYYALSIDQLVTPFGIWLLQFPKVLETMTVSTLVFEAMGWVLLIFPLAHQRMRLIGILAFVLLHLGFRSALQVGPFTWVNLVSLLPFLPPVFWQKILPGKPSQPLQNFRLHSFEKIAVGFFMAYCLWWNLGTLNPSVRMSLRFQNIAAVFRVDQYWNMFSPFPLKEDGWYVMQGLLANGSEVDLFREGTAVTWEKPTDIASMYSNERWRKYLMNIWAKKNAAYRPYYADYLCRDWNRSHSFEEQLRSLKIVFNLEFTPAPGEPQKPIERVTLFDQLCRH